MSSGLQPAHCQQLGWVPPESQILLNISGWQLFAWSRAREREWRRQRPYDWEPHATPPSQEVRLYCCCVYTIPTRTGLEVLISHPKTNSQTNKTLRVSQRWWPGSLEDLLLIVDLECVLQVPTPVGCRSSNHLKWWDWVRTFLQFSGLTVQVSQPDGGVMLVLTDCLKNTTAPGKVESGALKLK